MNRVSILIFQGNPDQSLLGFPSSSAHGPGSHFSSAWGCQSLSQQCHKSAGLQPYSLLILTCLWDFLDRPQTKPIKLHPSDCHLAVTRSFSCHQSSLVHLAQVELDDALSVKALTLPLCVCVIILGSCLLFSSGSVLLLLFPDAFEFGIPVLVPFILPVQGL